MSLTPIQQLLGLIESSKHILIAFSPGGNVDSVGAALAWKIFLEKQGKQADAAADGFEMPKSISFLPKIETVRNGISHLQKFIIKVDISRAQIDTLSYDIKDHWLSIYLTPKEGVIGKNDLRTAASAFKYDLIITVGAHDLESLGPIFFNNTDLFYRVPVVNFDHRPSNEQFGQLNFVELTTSSTSEAVTKILEQLGEASINEQIATCLLTGMISQTRSFKTPNVTPYTLAMASRLMNLGADRDKIVQHLYRTKTLGMLKLWGQALSHLQNDAHFGIVWTTLTHEDFVRAGAKEDDLRGLIDELIGSAPEARIIFVLHEHPGHDQPLVHGVLVSDKQYDAETLTQPFNPQGTRRSVSFKLEGKSLRDAEAEVLTNIKKVAQSLGHL